VQVEVTMQSNRSAGFTLLELIITIALLAIVLGLGVPSMLAAIQNTRITAQANELVTAFQLARSEAIKRGQPVSICGSNTAGGAVAPTCSNDAWSQGWIVFVDNQAPGSGTTGYTTAATDLLRVWPPPSGQAAIAGAGIPNFVRYMPQGNVDAGVSGLALPVTFSMAIPHCTGQQGRDIDLAATGRVTVTRVSC